MENENLASPETQETNVPDETNADSTGEDTNGSVKPGESGSRVNENTTESTSTKGNRKEVRQDWQKSYKELQSFHDKTLAETNRKLKELEEYKKKVDPYLDPLRSQYEAQRKTELQNKMQQDPQGILQELVQKELDARMAPIQEREIKAKADQAVADYRSFLGEESFKAYAPKMAGLVGEISQLDVQRGVDPKQKGSITSVISENPGYLLALTLGLDKMAEMHKGRLSKSGNGVGQPGQEKIQSQINNMNRISKGGNSPATNSNTNDLSNLTTDQLRELLVKQGVMKTRNI